MYDDAELEALCEKDSIQMKDKVALALGITQQTYLHFLKTKEIVCQV